MMSDVLKSVKLDNYILRTNYKMFIVPYVIGVVLAVLAKMPALTIAAVMVISAPFIGLFFQVYEKNNLSKLYGILPIGKVEVVIGRYLHALLLGISNGILATIVMFVIALVLHRGLDYLTFAAIASVTFLYFCLFIGILFPIYFKYTYSKVYMVTNLPIYLLAVLTALVVRKTHFIQNMGQVVRYFTSHPQMLWIGGIGLGLVLLIVSCSLSCSIYKRAEL